MQKWISLYDLIEVEEIKKAIIYNDRDRFLEILYALGFDIEKEITEESHNHRPMCGINNEVKFGVMYFGTERTDSEWIKKGSTIENIIQQYMECDPDLYKKLGELASHPNFAGMMCRHARGEEGFSEEYKELQ